jgi:hypothetical protein
MPAPSYLDRYHAGEREAVWAELTAFGSAICDEPLAAEAQAVTYETMSRARANVELLVQRLNTLGYQFVSDALGAPPTPHIPPTAAALANLRELQERYGALPLALQTWYQVVGTVDFQGVYPRLSAYESFDPHDLGMYFQGQRLRVSLLPEVRILGVDPQPDPTADPDTGIAADPLVIWPCIEALVDEFEEESEEESEATDRPTNASRSIATLGFAPDALQKANVSGGDGPHMDFGEGRMDAPLRGDDWEGVSFITYLRTVFAWGGFPGLRAAVNPPRDLLTFLCEGLLPL